MSPEGIDPQELVYGDTYIPKRRSTMKVFTPLNATRTERLRFDGDKVEIVSGNLNVRRIGKKAVVRIDGKMYQVYGASCGLPNCQCDACIKEVV